MVMTKRLLTAGLLTLTAVMFNSAVAEPAAHEAIKKSLRQILPDVAPDQITPSPIKGIS